MSRCHAGAVEAVHEAARNSALPCHLESRIKRRKKPDKSGKLRKFVVHVLVLDKNQLYGRPM